MDRAMRRIGGLMKHFSAASLLAIAAVASAQPTPQPAPTTPPPATPTPTAPAQPGMNDSPGVQVAPPSEVKLINRLRTPEEQRALAESLRTPTGAAAQPAPDVAGQMGGGRNIVELYSPYTQAPQYLPFNELVGDWDLQIYFWPEPAKEPVVSKGVATVRRTMAGLFLEERLDGTLGTQAFRSLTNISWNDVDGVYESVRVTNTNPVMIVERGTIDNATRRWEFAGEYKLKGYLTKQRTVMTNVSDIERNVEVFFKLNEGIEFRGVFMVYTRHGATPAAQVPAAEAPAAETPAAETPAPQP